MKRMVIYGVLLAAAILFPTETTQLGKMKPVETVLLRESQGMIAVETDTDDHGSGITVAQAIENLKESTAGILYLDTADYLLVSEEAKQHIPEMAKYLKEGTRVCVLSGELEICDAARYLEVHRPEMQLKYWKPEAKMDVLVSRSGRFTLK